VGTEGEARGKELRTGQTKGTRWLRNLPRSGGHHGRGGTDVVSRLARCTKFAGGDKRSGTLEVRRQRRVQQRGAGWRVRILIHHRRRHGGLPEPGGQQRERRQLLVIWVFRALEEGNMGRKGSEWEVDIEVKVRQTEREANISRNIPA
jgi:hypothetical protein